MKTENFKADRDLYLIESMEHYADGDFKVWWKPKKLGYTESIDMAGRYSREEAEKICSKAGSENERMWSEAQVRSGLAGRVETVVRM